MSAPSSSPPGAPLSVADRVRQLRERRGWTQAQLAHAAQLTRGTVSRVERGAERPRGRTAEALAQALGVGAAELLGLTAGQGELFPSVDSRRMAVLRRLLGLDDDAFERAEPHLARALERAERPSVRPSRRAPRVDGKSGA